MLIKRPPRPALRPFVELVWVEDGPKPAMYAQPLREHVLPTGAMHLVFRLNDCPLRIFDSGSDSLARCLDGAIVGGARSRYYLRELSAPSYSAGVVLRPGAAEHLVNASAAELADRHTPLDDLWGARARSVHEQLLDAKTGTHRLAILENALATRLARVRNLLPCITAMLTQQHVSSSVAAAVQRSGLSHRHFIAQFHHAVGLTPKTYLRVQRFQDALRALRQSEVGSLATLAGAAGYSDQAHFNREFIEFCGVTPTTYLKSSPSEANHLPVQSDARRRT